MFMLLNFEIMGEIGRRSNHINPAISVRNAMDVRMTNLVRNTNLELLVASDNGMRSSDLGITLMMINRCRINRKTLKVMIVMK